jgi:sugar lactone lactonase YvrE
LAPSRVAAVRPARAIEGGRISILGSGFDMSGPLLPVVSIGGQRARVVYASSSHIDALVPPVTEGGHLPIAVGGEALNPKDDRGGERNIPQVEVGATLATELHQVDNPACDALGNLYFTFSGSRGEEVPVSIFRVRPDGRREIFAKGIVNATSMAVGPDHHLYVSSRFEGTVYRVGENGVAEPFATDLGVACGLAFTPDGTLFVGDRTGSIFRVNRSGHATTFASLPASVAAFHLAFGPDGSLYVTGPTLGSYDAVYRIDSDGTVGEVARRFGRPQGLAFDPKGELHVVEALAGLSGVYRVSVDRPSGSGPQAPGQVVADTATDVEPELVVAGPGLVGIAFDRTGRMVVCTNDTAYRFL